MMKNKKNMKPVGFIYLTTCLVNGKIYIGRHEISKKKRDNREYLGSGTLFKRALEKYGKENFKRKILRLCFTEHELTIWEHVYIKKYYSQDKNIGYNIADGDVNTSDYNPAKLPEVRKKISESTKNRFADPVNCPMYGKHHTKEAREKIRKKHLGRKHTDETKKKMSEHSARYMLGKKLPCSVKVKISKSRIGKYSGVNNPNYGNHKLAGEKNPMYGKHHTDETKKKISDTLKSKSFMIGKKGTLCPNFGRKCSEETKKKISEKKSGTLNSFYGKHHTEETKKKMSISISNTKKKHKTFWVTNDIESKLLFVGDKIPDGWRRGRIIKKKTNLK